MLLKMIQINWLPRMILSLCLGPIGDFRIGDGEKNNYTRDASRCLVILSINTSRLFAEGLVIPLEHRLMLVNFYRECIGDAKKKPSGTEALGAHATHKPLSRKVFHINKLILSWCVHMCTLWNKLKVIEMQCLIVVVRNTVGTTKNNTFNIKMVDLHVCT